MPNNAKQRYLEGLEGKTREGESSIKKLRFSLDNIWIFLSKSFFLYLPIIVFYYISYEKEIVEILPNLYLSLSFVFIAQINNFSFKNTAFANFLFAIKIGGIIFSLVSFGVTNVLTKNLLTFFILIIISVVTLFFSIEFKKTEEIVEKYNK
ncbi:hypothetical protein [Campylobacter jejuni]|uniref:hypothetical protein n=1 Tax=Campylobacter jejuni TaxID=197 RepID=UPI00069A4227|nr:hypothetical protein [Campylobacter jejuni]HEF3759448.1 hypothetical protein [Campylobacter jejuni]HEF7280816.1 hypothetical protein [Campylobacter jejuni]HEG7017092.1 hypothetical protein [Campylobacter jejuni]